MSGCGIVFDLDGTLADTLPDIAGAVNAGLVALGLPGCSIEQVRAWVGEGLPTLCARALGSRTDARLDRLVQLVTDHYAAHRLERTRPYPGIPQLLASLAADGVPMAVLTNKPHVHTVPIVEALFGAGPFVEVRGYQREERRKPDPGDLLEIAACMGLSPAAVLMVGDSATDMLTARNAGARPVGVTWGYRSREELLAAGAAHLIDRPAELLQLL